MVAAFAHEKQQRVQVVAWRMPPVPSASGCCCDSRNAGTLARATWTCSSGGWRSNHWGRSSRDSGCSQSGASPGAPEACSTRPALVVKPCGQCYGDSGADLFWRCMPMTLAMPLLDNARTRRLQSSGFHRPKAWRRRKGSKRKECTEPGGQQQCPPEVKLGGESRAYDKEKTAFPGRSGGG